MTTRIVQGELPATALLQRYRQQLPPAYTDCFTTVADRVVTLEAFVDAFYKTPLFRLERLILKFLANLPSTDADVQRLLAGTGTKFAAWSIEDREKDQLLMCDLRGRTRSWFMVAAETHRDRAGTRLYFGSAVVPPDDNPDAGIGRGFSLMLRFHQVYSVLLLRAARKRLARTGR